MPATQALGRHQRPRPDRLIPEIRDVAEALSVVAAEERVRRRARHISREGAWGASRPKPPAGPDEFLTVLVHELRTPLMRSMDGANATQWASMISWTSLVITGACRPSGASLKRCSMPFDPRRRRERCALRTALDPEAAPIFWRTLIDSATRLEIWSRREQDGRRL